MNNVPLSDIFHITERFQRSVHLERDFYTENALDGYVVTVKARETLTRLISAQENSATLESMVPHRSLWIRKISVRALCFKTTRRFQHAYDSTGFRSIET